MAKLEILEEGYIKKVNIGDKFIGEFSTEPEHKIPAEIFFYYNSRGKIMILKEFVKVSEDTFSLRPLKKEEVTNEIKDILIKKGYSF